MICTDFKVKNSCGEKHRKTIKWRVAEEFTHI